MKIKIKRDGETVTVVKLKMTLEEYNAVKESIGNLSVHGNVNNGTPIEQARLVEKVYFAMPEVTA